MTFYEDCNLRCVRGMNSLFYNETRNLISFQASNQTVSGDGNILFVSDILLNLRVSRLKAARDRRGPARDGAPPAAGRARRLPSESAFRGVAAKDGPPP